MDGYQYEEKPISQGGNERPQLQFFPTAEGYVKAVYKEQYPFGGAKFQFIYNYTDHLGNIRLSYTKFKYDIVKLEETHYYPFGLKHGSYYTTAYTRLVKKGKKGKTALASKTPVDSELRRIPTTDRAYKYKYNGKEWQEELDLNVYAYGWRDYDPAIGRFNKIDRFAEKYYKLSTYSYAGNNPILFVDVQGDSINLSRMQQYDNIKYTNYKQTLISSLENVTGLSLSTNKNGNLIFNKDAKGNAIISTTTDVNGNTTKNGSSTAREDLISSIRNENDDIMVRIGKKSSTSESLISISPKQINNFINGTSSKLNNETMGFGLVFLHEIRHTPSGGSNHDPDKTHTESTGPVVDRVNIYRNELDTNPQNKGLKPYGQRLQYYNTPNSLKTRGSIYFRYQTKNKKGKTVYRRSSIYFNLK